MAEYIRLINALKNNNRAQCEYKHSLTFGAWTMLS